MGSQWGSKTLWQSKPQPPKRSNTLKERRRRRQMKRRQAERWEAKCLVCNPFWEFIALLVQGIRALGGSIRLGGVVAIPPPADDRGGSAR